MAIDLDEVEVSMTSWTKTIMAIDPGLASFGLTVIRTDGQTHDCVLAETFTSSPRSERPRAEDRERRTRDLSYWFSNRLALWQPAALAAEEMWFPRGANAIIAISLAWGVIINQVESRSLPMVCAGPKVWRRSLAPSGSEKIAHRAALKAVPSFAVQARHIVRRNQVHARDALGVFCWSLTTKTVKEMLGG